MADGGRPNPNFAAELRKYEKGRIAGTPENALRRDYPGTIARERVCTDTACINYRGDTGLDTYFLCDACGKVAPCVIAYLRNAPYKVLPTKTKREQANRASFAAWISLTKRGII